MRLFVAVEIESALAERIAEVGDELKRRAIARAPRARITWIPSDRMHLTVRFIGEVEESRVGQVRAALTPLRSARFELTVRGVGAFPRSGAPRVLWAGITDGVEALAELEREVSERLAGCGIPGEDRPYRPHLTLARVRDAAGLRTGPLIEGLTDHIFGSSQVDAITLFQSRLSPKGPQYMALHSTPLQSSI